MAKGKPGEATGQSFAPTWTAASPVTTLSNAPEETTVETLAYMGGSRWRIGTEFETEKGEVGLDEYEDPQPGRLASPHSYVTCWAEPSC